MHNEILQIFVFFLSDFIHYDDPLADADTFFKLHTLPGQNKVTCAY